MTEKHDEERLKDGVYGLAPGIGQLLDEIKRRGRLRRAAAAGSLVGAAVVTLWLGPTTAIVFASLSLAAVSVFPPLRRAVMKAMGESIALRDASGHYRFLAAVHDGHPFVALCDESLQRLHVSVPPDGLEQRMPGRNPL